MRQLIESIIVFQAFTSKFSPIHKWIGNKPVKLTSEERQKKWLAYSAAFILVFIVQVHIYTSQSKFLFNKA
jgi:hypothetical protein